MRMSLSFGTTLREPHPGARTAGQALLSRAGFIRGGAPFSFLPAARRAIGRIETILRGIFSDAGAQELLLPHAGMTRGEAGDALRSLFRSELRSWRQLPLVLTQVCESPSPRAEALAVAASADELAERHGAFASVCRRLFDACGVTVEEGTVPGPAADGPPTIAFLAPGTEGAQEIAQCPCGYRAPWPLAGFRDEPDAAEEPLPLGRVATPECSTIEQLSAFLGIGKRRTAKAVMLTARLPRREGHEERFVFAVVRGDRELSEEKLAAVLGADALCPATEEEIRAAAAVPGYASPVGLSGEAVVVVDAVAARSANLVAGANEAGYHLTNVNIPRDFTPALVHDIAAARKGDACPRCGRPMTSARATLLAALAERVLPSEAVPRFQDAAGRESSARIATLELDIASLFERIAEEHHDERGLLWPAAVSPFDVHVVCLGGAGSSERDAADRLTVELEALGCSVLFDDRDESAGVKFTDADLIGVPLRLTVSRRGLAAGSVELKLRAAEEKRLVALDAAAAEAALVVMRFRSEAR